MSDENAVLASRLGRLLDQLDPGWRDSPEGRWLNAVERPSSCRHCGKDHAEDPLCTN